MKDWKIEMISSCFISKIPKDSFSSIDSYASQREPRIECTAFPPTHTSVLSFILMLAGGPCFRMTFSAFPLFSCSSRHLNQAFFRYSLLDLIFAQCCTAGSLSEGSLYPTHSVPLATFCSFSNRSPITESKNPEAERSRSKKIVSLVTRSEKMADREE